jgi:hypothetical protein
MMASDDGDAGGDVVEKRRGFLVGVIDDADAEIANVHELECESESDGEGRLSEKSDHWKESYHVPEASENAQESDIVDAGAKKTMRIFVRGKDWKQTDASSAAPAIIPRSVV